MSECRCFRRAPSAIVPADIHIEDAPSNTTLSTRPHKSRRGHETVGKLEAKFEVLLYDLTSTYFECDPPDAGKRRHGYSRDKRSDCVQVVIALIVTPDGPPLTYEVMPGNTSDKTTLRDFLQRIEAQYGKAGRTWVMDRGIPIEAVLAEIRAAYTSRG